MNKFRIRILSFEFKVFLFSCSLVLLFSQPMFSFAQDSQSEDLEFTIDVNAPTIPLPKIFQPNIDLSGRGSNLDTSWPQNLAANTTLDTWKKGMGFSGIYRLQYSLWDINQLAKDKEQQKKLLLNYEDIIKDISASGGAVILNIFSTPAGLGKVLDKKSFPWDLNAFKELIKGYIRELSCNKKYNIWYEVWSAPDLDMFFLGRTPEYLNLYKAVAEAVKELEAETNMHIPIGGPSASWWFQNPGGNTILTPENSLIYELIKFCSQNKLPLDFISWHAYSQDPKADKEKTPYNHTAVVLIREWLSYFNLDKGIPLIIDEWNYDSGGNVLAERKERSYIAASYILSRLKNMLEAGIDYQLFFCLEDFDNKKEGITRNLGIFWFEQTAEGIKNEPKAIYNTFKMLGQLGDVLLTTAQKKDSEFVGVIATKKQEDYIILIYNYIDPDILKNYLSRNVVTLNEIERNSLLEIIKTETLDKLARREIDISGLQIENKVKAILTSAQELDGLAKKYISGNNNMKIIIKNLKEKYIYRRYVLDSSCGLNCDLSVSEEKEINAPESYEEILSLSPYSVTMIHLKRKPQEQPVVEQQPQVEVKNITAQDISNQGNITNTAPVNAVGVTENQTAPITNNGKANIVNATQ